MHYLHYDREQLDRQYNVRSGIPRFQDIFDRWNQQADVYRQQLTRLPPMRSNLHYGMHRLQTLDYFPVADAAAPLLVFVHGGYWRSLDKNDFSHLAEPYRQAGIAVAMLNYRLAPEVDIPEIVADVRAAFAWLYRQASSYGFDTERIYVMGHSAGGHLAAALASTDWRNAGLPTDAIKGLCGVSGLYDLEPIRLCYLNETLQLDGPQVQQYSPLHHLPATKIPVILTAGGAESAEFHRQKNAYALALHGAGFPVQQVKLADGHHLDVIDKLADGSSELAQAIIAMAGK
ncbi:esterase [Herbaspirillum sp. meg3]|uniref:alpha/beta hydrolase n=1 Tax=Herbaspirillum sp. meg3 TaxID=2025949 RepID=UPI000B98C660|nr:alpha/beta hydrolase [Herbaspirillum sp. meg3]ASU40090.1 esterase [Herbaspirillum sp. meg3]